MPNRQGLLLIAVSLITCLNIASWAALRSRSSTAVAGAGPSGGAIFVSTRHKRSVATLHQVDGGAEDHNDDSTSHHSPAEEAHEDVEHAKHQSPEYKHKTTAGRNKVQKHKPMKNSKKKKNSAEESSNHHPVAEEEKEQQQQQQHNHHQAGSESTPQKWRVKPRLILFTKFGNLTMELEPEAAPLTVANVLRNAKEGYLNKSACFYRYEKGFVLQGGACGGKRGKNVPLEYNLPNVKHSVALARSGDPNSGGSEFFINLRDNTQGLGRKKKGGYAVFAHVIDGFDTIQALKKLPTIPGRLTMYKRPQPTIQYVEVIEGEKM